VYSVVAHRYWGSPGGGQLVCASAAVSLDKLGFTPVLTGTFRFDPGRYVEWYNIDISSYPVITLMKFNIKAFGLWSRLFVWRPAAEAIRRFNAEILFIDEPTYKPLLGRDITIIEYIHFPLEVYIHSEDPYIRERYGSFPMSIYWGVFMKLLPRYLRDNPFIDADLVLTNSKWTAEVAREVYGEEPLVLNPPVPPNALINEPAPFEERLPLIVMLGRFSEEKRYHWVITEVMPRLIKEINAKLIIFGGATTRTQLRYVEKVTRLASDSGLKVEVLNTDVTNKLSSESHIYLRLNAPRTEINRIMDKARVFLHATINEHWGIAVAEAMARGLPVVVHKSGGAWSDLAQEAGLGYQDVDEAIEQITKALTDPNLWRNLSYASIAKARELTLDSFSRRFKELLKL